jgi:sortase A
MRVLIRLPGTRPPIKRLILTWSAVFFFLIGVVALGYWAFASLNAKAYQTYQAWQFQRAIEETSSSANKAEVSHIPLPSLPGHEDRQIRGDNRKENPKNRPVGRIEIPQIGLSAMVLEGTDGSTLRLGVGHILGTPLPGEPGNVALAGHRDTFFRDLRNVREQDQIILTTLEGSFHYDVDLVEVVEPENTSVLRDSGSPTLTLVTCFPFYYVGPAPKRFVVQAHLISDWKGVATRPPGPM